MIKTLLCDACGNEVEDVDQGFTPLDSDVPPAWQTPLPKELAPQELPEQPEPPTVTLCGSTRFRAEPAEVNLRETVAGRMVLAPACDLKQPHPAWGDPATAEALKTTGYIGQSTHREIAYALRRRFTSTHPTPGSRPCCRPWPPPPGGTCRR